MCVLERRAGVRGVGLFFSFLLSSIQTLKNKHNCLATHIARAGACLCESAQGGYWNEGILCAGVSLQMGRIRVYLSFEDEVFVSCDRASSPFYGVF
ncbi:hypothetical protein F4809DRAFT_599057 [Biscogniauxia mediterranea]|nr:hypothetical protein F4809DRAFT_599057 [Biscogniauxia mediterranea]